MTGIPPEVCAALGLTDPDVQPLPGGPLNRALRVRDAGRDLVVRLPHAGGVALGVDHRSEFAMQQLAAAGSLAPPLVFVQPATGLLVTGFVAGRTLARADLHEPALLRRLGSWFARLHALPVPPDLAFVDFGARAAGFLAAAAADGAATVAATSAELASLRAALGPPAVVVPCHHDLHHRNLIDTGSALVAVDWEYAGPGDPAADLAACIGYHELDAREVEALLSGYGPGAAALAPRLPVLTQIFAWLCAGWAARADRLQQAALPAHG